MATAKVENWWGCADTTAVESEIEPVLGGKYSHKMTLRQSYEHTAKGIITNIDPPALLAYELTGGTPEQTMTVRVEFIVQGSGTLVRLTHENIPEQFGEFVTDGWTAAFGKLYRFFMQENAAVQA